MKAKTFHNFRSIGAEREREKKKTDIFQWSYSLSEYHSVRENAVRAEKGSDCVVCTLDNDTADDIRRQNCDRMAYRRI